MPRQADGTRRRILEVAYDLFYRDGFARAGVDAIAEAAGITKRTLYYHYESKDALLAAVLDVQHEIMLSRIQRWASRASGDPATMVEIVFAEFARWAKKPAWKGSGFTRVAMELADLPGHPARAAASRHKAAVEGWFAEQFTENGVGRPRDLARQVMLLIEGCLSLVLIHGDTSYAEAAATAARQLVERDRQDRPSRPEPVDPGPSDDAGDPINPE
jgi:AcrR family transcriptional regulator